MERRVIAISGRIRSGKSTLATALSVNRVRLGGHPLQRKVIGTRAILEEEYSFHPKPRQRPELQAAGEKLDMETGGRWVARSTRNRAGLREANTVLIIDAVRRSEQLEGLRAELESPVFHVHLSASARVRRKRYEGNVNREGISFEEASRNATEQQVDSLKRHADIHLRTGFLPRSAIALLVRIAFYVWCLGLTVRANFQVAVITIVILAAALLTLLLAEWQLVELNALSGAIWLINGAVAGVLVATIAAGAAKLNGKRERVVTSSSR